MRLLLRTLIFFLCWFYESSAQNIKYRILHIGNEQGLSQGSVYAMCKDTRGYMWFGTQDGLNRWNGQKNRVFRPSKMDGIGGIEIKKIINGENGNLWIGTEECLNRFDYENETFKKTYFRNKEGVIIKNEVFPIQEVDGKLLAWVSSIGLVEYNYKTNKQRFVLSQFGFVSNYFSILNSTQIGQNQEVWIHSEKGILRFNLISKKIDYYFSNSNKNIAGKAEEIVKILYNKKKIWMATFDGLMQFDPISLKIKRWRTFKKGLQINHVYDLDIDSKGNLWLATEKNGILIFDPKDETFEQISSTSNFSRYGLLNMEVSQIYIDDEDVAWANTDPYGVDRIQILPDNFGFFKLGFGKKVPEAMHNFSIRGIVKDSLKNELWLGTQQTGIWRVNANTFEIIEGYFNTTAKQIPSNTIRYLHQDQNKNIWIGTTEGLAVFEKEKFRTIDNQSSKGNFSKNFIRVIEEFENHLFIGTESGVFRVNKSQKRFDDFEILDGKRISMLKFLNKNELLVGIYNGGLQLLKSVDGFKTYKTQVLFDTGIPIMAKILNNQIWVASSIGLVEIDMKKWTQKWWNAENGLPNSFVYAIEFDEKGALWMSTNKGLVKYIPKQNRFFSFSLNDGLQGLEFNGYSSFKENKGRLFFGGINGMNYFLPREIYTLEKISENILNQTDESFVPPTIYSFHDLNDAFKKPERENNRFLNEFKLTKNSILNFKYTKGAAWLRVPIRNQTNKNWYLEIENSRLNEIEIWVYERNQLVWYKKAGDSFPFKFSEVKDSNPIFKLELVENQDYELFVRARTTRDLKVPITFWDESVLSKHLATRKLIWGIYIGFMILISLYNIFLWLTIKDKAYLYYALKIFLFGLFQLSLYGFGYEYLWSNHPFNEPAFIVFLFSSYVFLVLFTESFLELNFYYGKKWQVFKKALLSWFLIWALISILKYNYLINFIAIFSGILLSVLFILICIAYIIKKRPIIFYYGLATFFLVFSSMIVGMQNLGFFQPMYQEYIIMMGSMLEIILFSIALGYKFSLNQRERIRQQALRNEISNNLHDDLAASLSSLTMFTELSKRKLNQTNNEIMERFDKIALKSREILSKVREAVYELNPNNDEENEWLERIVSFGKEIFENRNMAFKAHIPNDFESSHLEIGHRKEVLLIFKELMNNAAKYSNATTAEFEVEVKGQRMKLTLRDNGAGFDVKSVKRGNGLTSIEARSNKIGAKFDFKSAKLTGTVASIETYYN